MKKYFAFLLLICFLATKNHALALDGAFTDVPKTSNNYIAINYLSEKGIIHGYSDKIFKPLQLVNRVEALKMILVANKVQVPESTSYAVFSDFSPTDWFAPFVMKAKDLGIITGNLDGTFAPGRNVARSEFIKMLLLANAFKTENWIDQELFNDVPKEAWFAPYMNYAGASGLIPKDTQNNLYPTKELNRGEVAEIVYLMAVIKNSKDTQFLLNQAEAHMAQVGVYMTSHNMQGAKRASELAVDMTQQAYKNMPDNNIVLGDAKLARAYDFLVNSSVALVEGKNTEATDWANQAIAKATEAWEVNNALQPTAKDIKNEANKILVQLAPPEQS